MVPNGEGSCGTGFKNPTTNLNMFASEISIAYFFSKK
jgi:hypothetical protein